MSGLYKVTQQHWVIDDGLLPNKADVGSSNFDADVEGCFMCDWVPGVMVNSGGGLSFLVFLLVGLKSILSGTELVLLLVGPGFLSRFFRYTIKYCWSIPITSILMRF